jgi:glycosyltransferase involved in cell wall biosynthesis
MRVLILNYEFPPMGGGAGYASYNLSKQLARRGHDVTVLTSRYGDQAKQETQDNIRIIRCLSWRKSIHDCGLRGALTYLLSSAVALIPLKMWNDFDVLHYFFSFPTGLLSYLPYAFRKVPYIVSLRGSDVPGYDPYNKKIEMLHGLLLPLNKGVWKSAARVVALSNSLRNLAQAKLPQKKMEIIPNGIESDLFFPDRCIADDNGTYRFITVSRLVNRKGIDLVLHALAELKDDTIELLIVGSGNYEGQLKRLVHELDLEKSVRFYGYCLREKLPDLYNTACAFILPSRAESFGMVFVEAMACGLPVIGAKTGGVVDLVDEDCGILVDNDDVEQIKQAIVQIKQSGKLRHSMGACGQKRAETHFTWEAVADRYEQIYVDVVEKNDAPEHCEKSSR